MQEAVEAGDLQPLDVDAANVFSRSERILQVTFISTIATQQNGEI
jgi:hypothetical protein